MSQAVKVSITKKDLYSKEYHNIQVEYDTNNGSNRIKTGLVQLMVRIIKELN